MVKQYIVINGNTGWTKGKIASQVAHASMKVFFDLMRCPSVNATHHQVGDEHFEVVRYHYEIDMTQDLHDWKEGIFTKVVVKSADIQGITAEERMKELAVMAEEKGVPFAWVIDSGKTQETENPVTLAIGPFNDENEKYKDLVTRLGEFKLY